MTFCFVPRPVLQPHVFVADAVCIPTLLDSNSLYIFPYSLNNTTNHCLFSLFIHFFCFHRFYVLFTIAICSTVIALYISFCIFFPKIHLIHNFVYFANQCFYLYPHTSNACRKSYLCVSFCGAAAQRGSCPPHSRGFWISHTTAHHSR